MIPEPARRQHQNDQQAHDQPQEHTPILISGGGLVGLSTGLFLQHLGVPFILIEQRDTLSVLPRARGFHVRSMELFRQVQLEDALNAAATAWKVGSFGGAWKGSSVLESQPIAGVDRKAMLRASDTVPSPCQFLGCPQRTVEEVLLGALLARGGDVRFSHRLDHFTQDHADVTATITDVRTGHLTTTINADYLIAADGGRGQARHALHIDSDRTPAQQHFLNIFFRADLTDRLEGRTFSQCEIQNDQVQGTLASNDNATEWSFHLQYDPQVTDPLAFTPDQLITLVRSAIGDPQQPVEIIATSPWNTAVRVARQYRERRVFLLGDAAHVMPPSGGFNGNTGIADAHNLAWKLAAVLAGRAGEELLESYQHERRLFATRNGEQALLRTNFSARFGLETPENRATVAQQVDMNALHMQYAYPVPGGPDPERPVAQLAAQLGTRFPHAWLTRAAERLSTLDLFGGAPVLLLGPSARQDGSGAGWAADAQLCQLGKDVTFADPDMNWTVLTGLPDDGAVLIRPDGFVHHRSDAAYATHSNRLVNS